MHPNNDTMKPTCDETSVMIRSLRRRFWQALKEEDLDKATKIYTASSSQYEEWIEQEQAEAEQKRKALEEAKAREKQEKRDARPLKKLMGKGRQNSGNQLKGSNEGKGSFRRRPSKGKKENSSRNGSFHRYSANLDRQMSQSSTTSSAYGGAGLLQFELKPSEPFTDDDRKSPYDDSYDVEQTPVPEAPKFKLGARRNSFEPRRAGFFGRFGGADRSAIPSSTLGDDESLTTEETSSALDVTLTTPLHEVARLGGGSLLRLMISAGGDPNLKNGHMRTALHMAAGGLTKEEEELLRGSLETRKDSALPSHLTLTRKAQLELLGSEVGIRSNHADPEIPDESENNVNIENPASMGAKKAAKAMGRFFKHLGKGADEDKTQTPVAEQQKPRRRIDKRQEGVLSSNRMDAVLAILSWNHSDDGGERSGEGPSINSVDSTGRTALHYAAELGRADTCMAVLSSFGAILTIVDVSGQTPCELAGQQTHHQLASQLEARALLYSDPYGMDDEMMASVLSDSGEASGTARSGDMLDSTLPEYMKEARDPHKAMFQHVRTAPFSWFETWSMHDVRDERTNRINHALKRMREILSARQVDKEMNAFMFSHAGLNDSFNLADTAQALCTSIEVLDDMEQHTEDDCKPSSIRTVSISANDIEPKSEDIQVSLEDETATEQPIESSSMKGSAGIGDNGLVQSTGNQNGSECEQESSLTGVSEEEKDVPSKSDDDSSSLDKDEFWSATVPDGVVTDEIFTIGLDERDIRIRCPRNLQPGQSFYFSIKGKREEETEANLVEIDIVDENGDPLTETGGSDQRLEKDRENDSRIGDVPFGVGACLGDRIHASHAECFLTYHNWNTTKALDAFRSDPEKALSDSNLIATVVYDDVPEALRAFKESALSATCEICCEDFVTSSPKWSYLQGCKHGFCVDCLGDYLADEARSKSRGVCISCPHHECSTFLEQSEIESLSPRSEVYDALVRTADENFVASAERVRFCPHPGCSAVVRHLLPEVTYTSYSSGIIGLTGAVCRAVPSETTENSCYTYEGIQDSRYESMSLAKPSKPHRFCFQCGERMHWPVTCEKLEEWNAKVAEEVGTQDDAAGQENIDDVAHRLWMKANTRPCPKCKAPIEKNDGCNHMTCTNKNCRHEFCWICRKDWKLHNTETGGFFRCNRWQDEDNHEFYDDPPPPDQQRTAEAEEGTENAANQENGALDQSYGTAIHAARSAWKKSKIMDRFLHHYRRWTAHSESAALEQEMANTVHIRLSPVVKAAIEFSGLPDFNFGGKGLSFVHAAFAELMECRSFLKHSYAFAFYHFPTFYFVRQQRIIKQKEKEKGAFEKLQSELEMLTEQLSDIVARSHLRATQTQIIFLTMGAAEKRNEFTSFMVALLDKTMMEEKLKAEEQARYEAAGLNPPSSGVASLPARVLPAIQDDGIFGSINRPTVLDASFLPTPVHNTSLITRDFSARQRAEEDAMMRQAVHASMQAFMERSDPTNDLIDPSSMDTSQFLDWSCSACTYMNSGGRVCAMCGTFRS